MASAVLASGNEPVWAQSGGGFMGKIPYLNPNPNSLNRNPNPNPNSLNPKKKPKHFHHTSNGGGRHSNLDNLPDIAQAASDDAHSYVRKPLETSHGSGFIEGGYRNYDIASFSKTEISGLREKLASELVQIRMLQDRIESGQMVSTLHNPSPPVKSKNLIGNKRPGPPRSGRDPKKFSNGPVSVPVKNVGCVMDEKLKKDCRQILTKLLKHKSAWIFKAPVDAKALNLHDYHLIVKRPMDLGTIKTNLTNNSYQSPADFAADVRLTFNNAMLYNPQIDEVHGLAKLLLSIFENLFRPIQDKIDVSTRDHMGGRGGGLVDELQGNSWNHSQTPERFRKQNTSPIFQKQNMSPIFQKQEKMQSQSNASTPSLVAPQLIARPKAPSPAPSPSPVPAPAPVPLPVSTMNSPLVSPMSSLPSKQQSSSQALGRVKLPKPKAKDRNKREMSLDEQQKLGHGLQNLPQEKMPQFLQIIRKRTECLSENDEIEIDIQTLDTETLWELDRFVTNWRKTESKTKRQTQMTNVDNPASDINDSAAAVDQLNTFVAEVDHQVDTFASVADVDHRVDTYKSTVEVDHQVNAHTTIAEVDHHVNAHTTIAEVDPLVNPYISLAEVDHHVNAHTTIAEVDHLVNPLSEDDQEPVIETIDFAKKPRKGEIGDEDDIDVDDDMPITSFPTVEIEKDEAVGLDIVNDIDNGDGDGNGNGNGNGNDSSSSSSSSSTSSDSSSSSDSDSDSGSSSGSDSDAADDAAS